MISTLFSLSFFQRLNLSIKISQLKIESDQPFLDLALILYNILRYIFNSPVLLLLHYTRRTSVFLSLFSLEMS